MMTTDSLGLYVHIPYCVRKCNYCDFCSLPNGRRNVPDEYVAALSKEISLYKLGGRRRLDTVYFGGGTPSLLSPRQLSEIMASVRESFEIACDAEITFEANPGTVSVKTAEAFKAEGFNRVSLGLQSIHEKEMKKLGRIHDYPCFLDTFSTLRETGFDNINVDLMYGIPYQTKDSFDKTLRAVIALSPEHVSAYGLILEEGTPLFDEADSLPMPTLDEECDMYELATRILSEAGYSHYEISNYARQGRESRHNLLYWRCKDYIGVGAAAHSFLDGRRFFNVPDVGEYISGAEREYTDTDSESLAYEYAMLALRLSEGMSLSEYERRFSRSFTEGKTDILSRLQHEGLLTLDNERITFTERGFYVSNSILVEIL